MSQDLNQDEILRLADLLVRSQKVEARKALCIKIGIEPHKLAFISDPTDESFAINLISYLNKVGNTTAICQLCCQELRPIFQGGQHEFILKEIAAKVNCNPECISDILKPPKTFFPVKYKLLTGAVVLLTVIGFPVYYFSTLTDKREYYNQIENYLVNNNWRDADQETKKLIRDLLGNPRKEIIETEDMKKINCDDIKQINKLWEKYSDRRFGFKSQLLKWEESARDFTPFAYNVGWIEQPNEEVNYSKMKFDSITIDKKPKGYLPAGYDIDLGLPIKDFRTDNWFERVKSCLSE